MHRFAHVCSVLYLPAARTRPADAVLVTVGPCRENSLASESQLLTLCKYPLEDRLLTGCVEIRVQNCSCPDRGSKIPADRHGNQGCPAPLHILVVCVTLCVLVPMCVLACQCACEGGLVGGCGRAPSPSPSLSHPLPPSLTETQRCLRYTNQREGGLRPPLATSPVVGRRGPTRSCDGSVGQGSRPSAEGLLQANQPLYD